jgi:hypothetical protein
MQPNQETVTFDASEEHISPGATTARGGDTRKLREKGIGVRTRRRRGDRYGDVTPVQPLVMHQILYTHVVVVNCISYRINHKVRVCGGVNTGQASCSSPSERLQYSAR